jgi:hypothetical protein
MLKGRGSLQHQQKGSAGGNIVCPLHRWTYSPKGELLGAPHFKHDPCLNLNNYKLREWNGLLFEDNGYDVAADLAGIGPRADLDFTGFVLDHRTARVQLQLEDLHRGLSGGLPRRPVPPRPGQLSSPATTCAGSLARTTRCRPWAWPTAWARRAVPCTSAGTRLLAYRNGEPPTHGAIWLTLYPHIMVEWYPHVLTVSTLHPISPTKTLNMVEFYYPEEIAPSSANSSRHSRPPTWKPASRTTRSASAWTPAARPCWRGRQRSRPLPEPHGRRHAALSRVVPPDHGYGDSKGLNTAPKRTQYARQRSCALITIAVNACKQSAGSFFISDLLST